MKVTPQPTHGRPSYWVAKSVREPVFGLRPGFRRIRSEDEFHPDEITEAAPAKEEKKTGATSASCADGRPARAQRRADDCGCTFLSPPITPAVRMRQH